MIYYKKGWVFILLLIFFAILALAFNQFTYTLYDLNLYEYIKYSKDLSDEERLFLKEKEILYYTSDNNAPPFSFKEKGGA